MAKHDPDLSRIFHALGDPTRRALLQHMGQGVVPVSALAAPTGFALPTVLRHLSVLEDAGLIHTEKRGRTRLCRVVPVALDAASDWLAAARADWEARTDRLEAFLETLEDDDDAEPRHRP
jgi:DNA-binding transcriptional ArsR family regulator